MQKKGNTRIIAVAIATMAVIAVAIIAVVVIHPFGQTEQEYAIETLKYDYKNGDSQYTVYSVYEYDDDHTTYKVTNYDNEGGIVNGWGEGMIVEDDDENGNILTDISYDENGHELSEVTYDESNQITSREDYTYDDAGNLLSGQSTSEDSRQSDTYDEYGNLLTYSYSYGTGDECHVEQYEATSIPVK